MRRRALLDKVDEVLLVLDHAGWDESHHGDPRSTEARVPGRCGTRGHVARGRVLPALRDHPGLVLVPRHFVMQDAGERQSEEEGGQADTEPARGASWGAARPESGVVTR